MPGKTTYLGLNTALHDDIVNHETHLNENWNKIDTVLNDRKYYVNISEFPRLVGEADDTNRIQRAIDSFNTNNNTWSISNVGTILFPPGDYLIKNTLRMREGVYLLGVSPYSSRFRFDWSGSLIGISNQTISGESFTKNFGISNIGFLPDYNAPTPSSVVFLSFNFAIEPLVHNCRFILHKGAIGGGKINGTAIKLEKCINVDFDRLVFDGGLVGVSATGTEWGSRNGRFNNLFFYGITNNCFGLNNTSFGNVINNILVESYETSGSGQGLTFDSTSNDNSLTGFSIKGNGVKYGVICDSTKNTIVGTSQDATTTDILVRGDNNRIVGAFDSVDDQGKSNTLLSDSVSKVSNKQFIQSVDKTLTDVNVWYSVFKITLPSSGGVFITPTVIGQIEGVGRFMLRSEYFINRSTGATAAVENTAGKFSSGTGFEFQVINNASNEAEVQVRRVNGTSAVVSVGLELKEDGKNKGFKVVKV